MSFIKNRKFSCSLGSNCNQSHIPIPYFLLFPFLLAFVKRGIDTNAPKKKKDASRPLRGLPISKWWWRIVKSSPNMLFFFCINGGGVVENDGSTFVVGLSFFSCGLWDLLKGLSMFHLYSCKARNCISVSLHTTLVWMAPHFLKQRAWDNESDSVIRKCHFSLSGVIMEQQGYLKRL